MNAGVRSLTREDSLTKMCSTLSASAEAFRPRRHGRDSNVPRAHAHSGFTLIELMIVMVIISVLAGIALPSYQGIRERAQIAAAVAEIANLQQEITEFRLLNDRLPTGLAEIGRGEDLDPWGRPYEFADHDVIAAGERRMDRFLVPVNTDYDLYSLGPDGASAAPFTAAASRDDIVRANNGGFIGEAVLF